MPPHLSLERPRDLDDDATQGRGLGVNAVNLRHGLLESEALHSGVNALLAHRSVHRAVAAGVAHGKGALVAVEAVQLLGGVVQYGIKLLHKLARDLWDRSRELNRAASRENGANGRRPEGQRTSCQSVGPPLAPAPRRSPYRLGRVHITTHVGRRHARREGGTRSGRHPSGDRGLEHLRVRERPPVAAHSRLNASEQHKEYPRSDRSLSCASPPWRPKRSRRSGAHLASRRLVKEYQGMHSCTANT